MKLRHCDLCGGPTWTRRTGEPWGLEGFICGNCQEELQDEAALERWKSLSSQRAPGLVADPTPRTGAPLLPVLDGEFRWEDLTPGAAARVILARTRRIFRPRRRAS